ncbi:MAG: glycine cleavage system protein H [Chlamydiae bacterium RIFCSPLOWO2_12_FULL_49_12]|nr:MAG: glycine cleavage system protein H [Chlamydiae bacterium RIFCSPLOWO2_12_FULL_49_12]
MKYSKTHEWILIDEEGIGTVGISEHAKRELGDIVYVELPFVGKRVKQDEEVCVIESTKAAADLYAPVSGEVLAVNDLRGEKIEKLNLSPEKEGWLFKMRLESPDEVEKLFSRQRYLEMVT